MDSYFSTQMGTNQRRRANHAPRQSAGMTGYRLSSDDLSTGLEVRMVSMTTLPLDLVAELIRMRKTWDGADLPAFADTLN